MARRPPKPEWSCNIRTSSAPIGAPQEYVTSRCCDAPVSKKLVTNNMVKEFFRRFQKRIPVGIEVDFCIWCEQPCETKSELVG